MASWVKSLQMASQLCHWLANGRPRAWLCSERGGQADRLPAEPLLTGAAFPQCPAAREPRCSIAAESNGPAHPQTGVIRFPTPASGNTAGGGDGPRPEASCSPIQAGVCARVRVCGFSMCQ